MFRAVVAVAVMGVSAAGALLQSVAADFPPTQINGQTFRCGLPFLPAGVRAGLGVQTPVQLDGVTPATSSSEACLPPRDAMEYVLAADILAEVANSGQWTGLATGTDCKAMIVAVEWGGVSDAGDADRSPHPEAIQVCGPAPSANRLDTLPRVPGQTVRVLEVLGAYSLASQPAIRRITRQADKEWPTAVLNRLVCACRATAGGVCTASGFAADGGVGTVPLGLTASAGSWSGAGCIRKLCFEALEMVDVEGLGNSFPSACK